uniref:DNA ligase n=1 Tax=Fervidicoccus fontis TaxID=683846 RepID=A0A7J3ZKW7_9CREN
MVISLRFKLIAETLETLEKTSSRISAVNILVDLLKKTPKEVVDKVVYFLQGRLWPEWKGLPELGVGEKLIVKSISTALNVKEQQVAAMYKREGDLGRVAEILKKSKPVPATMGLTAFMGTKEQPGLQVDRVYETLARIALAQGEGSRDLKLRLLAGLIKEAEPIEVKFIIRFVEGRHRVGVGDMSILDALAIAYAGGGTFRPIVERAYNLRADLGEIARILVEKGVEEIKRISPSVGIPVKPMLAERHNNPREILTKVGGRALVEYKYDGERAQIHKKNGKITIFSRRLENITHMFPDVVVAVEESVGSSEVIVEGEMVAVNPDTGEMRPFQVLMTRKRKHDIHKAMEMVPVRVYLFDILYNNGRDLTVQPLFERRKVLEDVVTESDTVKLSEYVIVENEDELEKFFMKAIEDGAEGVMIKALHSKSIYQAGNRGWLWVKFKRDYKSEMSDTVDLVVVGAFYGKGRRAGKLSTLLMAAYDDEEDNFKTVCKVGTGFTDEELERMDDRLKPYIIPNRHPRVVSNIEPDVWVSPVLVAEIAGAELTLSPLHTCGVGRVKKNAGISIRFPRFIRWRDDKGPEEATTCRELIDMYRQQLRKLEEEPIEA